MRVIFLGTGTSQGVPIIGCKCGVCRSSDTRDKRLRSSVLIEAEGKRFIIDTGPDFREQMLRENIDSLDAVLYTHEHRDHVAGMDDIRALNYVMQRKMDLYANQKTQDAIRTQFGYVFHEKKYPGIPEVNMHLIGEEPFRIGGVEFIPIRVMHMHLPVLGFRIGDFTYITDANRIEESEKKKILGSRVLVLNALRREAHPSHFTLQEAVDLAQELNCPMTYLTHISHQLGFHQQVESELPPNIRLAHDGLQIEI